MRALIRGVALRRLRLEPGRSALLTLGVALGVAVFVAVQALNQTALSSLGGVSQVAAGSAALEIDGGAGGVPLSLLERVRATEGVRAAAPALARYAREAPPDAGGDSGSVSTERVLVLGIDVRDAASTLPDADDSVQVDPVRLLSPDAAVVSARLLERRGLEIGSQLELFLADGRRAFTIAGSFQPHGPISLAAGGDIVVLDLALAMKVFATDGRVDRIAIALGKGADSDEVARRLRSFLAPALDAKPPGKAVKSEALLGTMQLGLQLASLLALFIGIFLIYNAMSIAVVRRRPEIGVLRAVGTTKRQLALLFFAEAAAFGLAGSALGIFLGWLLAQAALGGVNSQVSQLYATLDARTAVLSPLAIVLGLLVGPLATVIATAPPVYQALTIAPVEAARKDLPRRDPRGALVKLAVLGGIVLLACAVGFFASSKDGFGLIGGAVIQAGIAGGAAAIAPLGSFALFGRVRPLLARIFGPVGALAADNILARPGRAGVTVAALMVALGGVLGISGLVTSLRGAVESWVNQVLSADIYAAASTPLGSQTNTLLRSSVADEIKTIEGVEAVYPLRFVFEDVEARPGNGLAKTAPALLVAVDVDFLGRRAHMPISDCLPEGPEAALGEVVKGDAVAVSTNLARHRGFSAGERISIRTPQGEWRPRVAICVSDFSSEHGCIFVDLPEYARRWSDTNVNAFDLFCKKGATDPEMKKTVERLRSRFGPRYDLFFTQSSAFRLRILSVVESAFAVTYSMQIVAIGVALLGVVTTMFAAILERTRDIGVLRAVGASRGHIRRAVVTEAFLLGAVASGFAVTTGGAIGITLVTRVISGEYGWELEYVFPWKQAIFGACSATVLATIAGALPAARAARVKIVEALAYA
ncbi:ABC transporter permease [bacterium]|nr:ABC transporter permease [bacterium]